MLRVVVIRGRLRPWQHAQAAVYQNRWPSAGTDECQVGHPARSAPCVTVMNMEPDHPAFVVQWAADWQGARRDRSGHDAGLEAATGLSRADDSARGQLNRNVRSASLASVTAALLAHQLPERKQVEEAIPCRRR